MNLKQLLNLNTYQWWRNHRRFVTLAIFLALVAGYIRDPIAKDFNVKDTCSRLKANIISLEKAGRKLNIISKDINYKKTPAQLRNRVISYCASYK